MKILIFGATGMVGDGVLRWLIASALVDRVVAVSRRPLEVQHPKLEAVIEPDMFHLREAHSLRGFDACFFCLGASSVGMGEAQYRRMTRDLTPAIGQRLISENPQMIFEFISCCLAFGFAAEADEQAGYGFVDRIYKSLRKSILSYCDQCPTILTARPSGTPPRVELRRSS